MKVAESTWQDIDGFSREGVVVIPTGSLEQHGPHLPLSTDTLIVTRIAEAVEQSMRDQILLLPTVWAGASSHHLPYAGSVSASFSTYMIGIRELIECYQRHRFRKFVLLNGHGGNSDPNRMLLREAKMQSNNDLFVNFSYFELIPDEIAGTLSGPLKVMRHGCEAETSLMLYLCPDLVRTDKIRDDGMTPVPSIQGLTLNFDELSEEGSIGYSTLATREKGELFFKSAVSHCITQLERVLAGFVLLPIGE